MSLSDALIVGAGPAGLAAAAVLARSGRTVRVVDRDPPGGQARDLGLIENYPGFPRGITGRALMDRFAAQARRWGARLERAEVRLLRRGADGFETRSDLGPILSRTVILACGSEFEELPGEAPREGVHHMALSAPIRPGRRVAVVGGGEAAAHQALASAARGGRVELVCRGPKLKVNGRLAARLAREERVRVHYGSRVETVLGGKEVEGIKIVSDGARKTIQAKSLLILIGKRPRVGLVPGGPFPDDSPFPDGLFMAGECAGSERQVLLAAASGMAAATACDRWLEERPDAP